MGDPAEWLKALDDGEDLSLKPWEQLQLLEHIAATPGDMSNHVGRLVAGPIPAFRLDDVYATAVASGNERIAVAVLHAGADPGLLDEAAAGGMATLCAALVDTGTRINRLYLASLAPVHHAALSGDLETARVLVEAACDLTVRTPDEQLVWELRPEFAALRDEVGEHGPRWFRDAQREGIDHYVFVDENLMFGFNPNDVQTPIWTGDEAEGFGWPNTPAQARELLDDNRLLRFEVEWFLPFLDKLEAGEAFNLDDLPGAVRVPRRRAAWR